jgi:acyl-CoA thioesterase-1
MKTTLLLLLTLVSATLAQQPAAPAKKPDPALAPITDEPGLPRVLLIGDSISIGYTLPTRDILKGKANLHRIPTNGGSTKDGLAKMHNWLGTGKWDVIHFNWGLHDLKHWKDGKMDLSGPQVSTTEEYEKNLRELVKSLKATGAKLIWATTTPVPEGSAGRVAGDDVKYNAVAAKVMTEAGVPINDLHALCVPKLAEWQLPKNVHFKPEGSRGLAETVSKEIETAIQK